MARLPAEIIARIISYLAADDKRYDGDDHFPFNGYDESDCLALAPYVTVSRVWQQRIEATTFAHIWLTTARLASPLAAQALTPDRVCRFVRSIHVDVVLPPYNKEARARHEDEADRAVNDGVFADAVRRLFSLLAGVGVDYRPKIDLALTASCVSDSEDMEERLCQWRVSGSLDADIYEARYESSYLDLRPAAGKSVQHETEALPELHCIKSFRVFPTGSTGRLYAGFRRVAPRAVCLMASKMQGLERITWDLSDNEKRDMALRKRLRTDFAYALPTLPSSLRHFNLEYGRSVPLNHAFQTLGILDETDHDDNDKLSLALHKLSHGLASFILMADVGPEVLWPGERAQDNDPLWPRMRVFSINPGAITPSGQWRFLRSDSNDSEDEEQDVLSNHTDPFTAPGDETEEHFRDYPDPDAVRALLLATARAVRRMPVLREMRFVLEQIGEGRLEVEYSARAGQAKLDVASRPVFHPDEEVIRLYREAAEEYVGAKSGLMAEVSDPWVY